MRRSLMFALLLAAVAGGSALVTLTGCDGATQCDAGQLSIDDLIVGTGDVAGPGSTVTVSYEGRLENGQVFDSGDSLEFNLGGVIPGFREGVVGMKEGGARRLTIPPNLAYGELGSGLIPPCETIRFEVTLIEVE